MLVLDCSLTMSWCFADEGNPKSDAILLSLEQQSVIVPSIWSLEVNNVLWNAERKGRINGQDADIFINLLSALPIELDFGTNIINKEILRLSRKFDMSSYDASYLELAARYKIALATLDQNLARCAKEHGVELV